MLRAIRRYERDAARRQTTTEQPVFKIRALQPFLVSSRFHPAALAEHSAVAAALCAWVLRVVCSRPEYLEWHAR